VSQLRVLRVCIEDEATYVDIALRLGCTAAAARQQASRGMRRLSERFQGALE
jgi:DNA-directed RNA polymerase specialized sigma24 family protein